MLSDKWFCGYGNFPFRARALKERKSSQDFPFSKISAYPEAAHCRRPSHRHAHRPSRALFRGASPPQPGCAVRSRSLPEEVGGASAACSAGAEGRALPPPLPTPAPHPSSHPHPTRGRHAPSAWASRARPRGGGRGGRAPAPDYWSSLVSEVRGPPWAEGGARARLGTQGRAQGRPAPRAHASFLLAPELRAAPRTAVLRVTRRPQ